MSVGRSTANHVRLIAVVAVVGLLLGTAFAVVRHPVYHAEARLVVGKTVSITNVAATAGLPAAAAQFASDYSRLAGTEAVRADAAKRLGHRNAGIGGLTASPIPNSPIIRVDSSATSAKAAVALANAGAQSIIDQVNQINQTNAATLNQLTQSYQQIEFNLNQDTETVNTLTAELAHGTGNQDALNTELNKAKAAVAVDNLEASAVQNQYQNQYSPVQADAQVVSLESTAGYTGSDRKSFLEIGVAGGLVGGVIVGMALAVLADLRDPRRRRRPVRDR